MSVSIRLATGEDGPAVLELVGRYHAFEGVPFEERAAASALEPLLRQGDAGRVWLIEMAGATIGYVALCFGYSIEFGGRDAFVDEMYLDSEYRGRGIGRTVLGEIQTKARALGVRALHLEVDRENERARRLYLSAGFASRERFHLMSLVL